MATVSKHRIQTKCWFSNIPVICPGFQRLFPQNDGMKLTLDLVEEVRLNNIEKFQIAPSANLLVAASFAAV